MSDPALTVAGLAVGLAGGEPLTEVNLTLPAGASLGLVGETGSGKTMTCRTLLGLQERIGARVIRGTITIDGEDVTSAAEERWQKVRGRTIALVPQASLSALDPLMKVGKQLEETIELHDPESDASQRSLELARQVDLPEPQDTLRRYPHELSGGMRQRVMIALALSGRPSILIADEPTTALDVTVQRRILKLLSRIRAESGMSLIFVSHDLSVVRAICDHVAIMYAGATIESGAAEQIFKEPAHPYTRALIAAQPALADPDRPLAAIGGSPPAVDARPAGCSYQPRCPVALERCRLEAPPQMTLERAHRASCWRASEPR